MNGWRSVRGVIGVSRGGERGEPLGEDGARHNNEPCGATFLWRERPAAAELHCDGGDGDNHFDKRAGTYYTIG